jgi:hypothetical protein
MSTTTWAVVSILLYVAIFALAIGLHLAGHRKGGQVPSVGVAMGWVMRTPTGRVITLLFWSWTGFHFFAR